MHKGPRRWGCRSDVSLIPQFSGLWTDTADWQGMRRLHRHLLSALSVVKLWCFLSLNGHAPPPTTHVPSLHPYPTPHHTHTHTVSQSSLCEYMNTVNCSDRVNYCVCYQATQHQNALWLPVSGNMEIRKCGAVRPQRQVRQFSVCGHHCSFHLIFQCAQSTVIFCSCCRLHPIDQ